MTRLKIECRECNWVSDPLPPEREEELFTIAMAHHRLHKHNNMVWVETNVQPVAFSMEEVKWS